MEDGDYNDLLASEHSSDAELGSGDEDMSEAEKDVKKLEEYRNKLLGATKGDISTIFRKRDLQTEGGPEMDVHFNVGFGEDIGQKMMDDKEEQETMNKESGWEKHQRKVKEKKRSKKEE
jgi:hypothetical protein